MKMSSWAVCQHFQLCSAKLLIVNGILTISNSYHSEKSLVTEITENSKNFKLNSSLYIITSQIGIAENDIDDSFNGSTLVRLCRSFLSFKCRNFPATWNTWQSLGFQQVSNKLPWDQLISNKPRLLNRNEAIIRWNRTGPYLLTHGYLKARESAPKHIHYQSLLTVRGIFEDCHEYS